MKKLGEKSKTVFEKMHLQKQIKNCRKARNFFIKVQCTEKTVENAQAKQLKALSEEQK